MRMNVNLENIPVTSMPIVQTPMVALNAVVSKDFMEMDSIVKVTFCLKNKTSYTLIIIVHLDEDECGTGNNTCDPSAACVNTHGGFNCECEDGWHGDGFSCSGKHIINLKTYIVTIIIFCRCWGLLRRWKSVWTTWYLP